MIFSYIRVSTDKQEKQLTYATQQFKIADYCVENNISVDKELRDTASGKNLDRPKIQELMDLLLDNPGSTLLVYDQSRLTREPRDLFILQDLFEKTNTKVIGVMSPIVLDTDEGEAMASFTAILDKYQRKKINRNIREGIKKRIEETGHWGPRPKFTDRRFDYYYQKKGITNKTSLAKLLGVSWPTINKYMKKRGLT